MRELVPVSSTKLTKKKVREIIKDKLEELDFHPRIYLYSKEGKYHYHNNKIVINRKAYYMLEIFRDKEMLNLFNQLNLKHEEKIIRKNWAINLLTNPSYMPRGLI